MTSNASSESELSSGEPQALKEEDVMKFGDQQVWFRSPAGKVDKRPPQKVPKLSSRKLGQIKVLCACTMYLYAIAGESQKSGSSTALKKPISHF